MLLSPSLKIVTLCNGDIEFIMKIKYDNHTSSTHIQISQGSPRISSADGRSFGSKLTIR